MRWNAVTRTLCFVLALGIATAPALSQEWARAMFPVFDHDFGSVARDAKAEFEFPITNKYVADVHIAGAKTSCGCTSVRITKPLLKTYETGAIVAHFNTDRFRGRRGATITVSLDRPHPATVRLSVRGYIHDDLILSPPSVDLGGVRRVTP